MADRLPDIYDRASWRSTTPVDRKSERVGVSFDSEIGHTVRLSLDVTSARHLLETLAAYLRDHDARR